MECYLIAVYCWEGLSLQTLCMCNLLIRNIVILMDVERYICLFRDQRKSDGSIVEANG
jgi:hypothetical protein